MTNEFKAVREDKFQGAQIAESSELREVRNQMFRTSNQNIIY